MSDVDRTEKLFVTLGQRVNYPPLNLSGASPSKL
jgi:hypothetical protein